MFYKKLCNIEILTKAWHLAICNSRRSFLDDSLLFEDYAYKLEKNLTLLSRKLENGVYNPEPLLRADIPKSSLAVRPGSRLQIEDWILMYAIVYLLSKEIDPKIPDFVYSFRLRKHPKKNYIFRDVDIIKFPFLKSKTIRRRVVSFDEWYIQWPIFEEKTIYAFQEEGYEYMTVTDIAAYFENIDHMVLRDILLRYAPKSEKIINLLIHLLETWSWRTEHGRCIKGGIPQGNDASSFLGNIYLIPLDKEFEKRKKNRDIVPLRYMDDVRIFTKNKSDAREALFLMNDVLRRLNLNIQGQKTAIIEREKVLMDLVDPEMNDINVIIDKIQGKSISKEEKQEYFIKLKEICKKRVKITKKPILKKDLRVFMRLLTAFRMINDGYMCDKCVKTITLNPDGKLLSNSIKYLSQFPRKVNSFEKVQDLILSKEVLFPYQEANLIKLLRSAKKVKPEIIRYAKKLLKKKDVFLYIKVQAALLINDQLLIQKSINSLLNIFNNESNTEVKKALIPGICQLGEKGQDQFIMDLITNPDYKLSRIGNMLFALRNSKEKEYIKRNIDFCFGEPSEYKIRNNLYKLEVIKYVGDISINKELLNMLKYIKNILPKNDLLNNRVERILNFLKFQIKDKERKTVL